MVHQLLDQNRHANMHRDKRNTLTGDSETCLLGQVLIAWALDSYFDLVWFGYISWEMATRLFEILLKELIHKAHLFGIRLHCMFWFTKTYESSTFESGYNCGARKNWIISDLFWQSDHPFTLYFCIESFVWESGYIGCTLCFCFTKKNWLIRVICSRIILHWRH